MPALPPVPGVYRVDLAHTWGIDTNARIRFFLKGLANGSQADVTALAQQINTAWGAAAPTGIAQITHTTCTLQSVTVTDLSAATGNVGISQTPKSGQDTGPPLAADAAIVIRFKVGRRYRGGHPKVFLPGGTTDDLTNPQQWLDASVAEFGSTWNNFVGTCSLSPGPSIGALVQVAVSFFTGNTVFITPSGRAKNISKQRAVPIVDTVVGINVDKNVGTQRRRTLIRP